MAQGHAAAPRVFVSLVQGVTANLKRTRVYLDDAIAHDVTPSPYIIPFKNNLTFALAKALYALLSFATWEMLSLNLVSNKTRIRHHL